MRRTRVPSRSINAPIRAPQVEVQEHGGGVDRWIFPIARHHCRLYKKRRDHPAEDSSRTNWLKDPNQGTERTPALDLRARESSSSHHASVLRSLKLYKNWKSSRNFVMAGWTWQNHSYCCAPMATLRVHYWLVNAREARKPAQAKCFAQTVTHPRVSCCQGFQK